MKPGKALEQLVAAIQDYLKDSKDTNIIRNAKLYNRSGVEREIDVFVQTKVQGMELGIAFECKDYSDKVGIEKIDAFAQKCRELPQINKKVMVASSGFTEGVVKEAQNQGIELYLLSEVPFEHIFSPYDIYHTTCTVQLPKTWRLSVEDKANPQLFGQNTPIFLIFDNSMVNEIEYIANMLQKHFPSMLSEIHSFLQSKQATTYDLPLEIKPKDKMYVVDLHGEKHTIDKMYVTVCISLDSHLQKVSKQNIYSSPTTSSTPIKITEYQKDDESLILIEGDKTPYEAYIKDSNGETRKTVLFPQIKSIC